jgi:hypothetical protein
MAFCAYLTDDIATYGTGVWNPTGIWSDVVHEYDPTSVATISGALLYKQAGAIPPIPPALGIVLLPSTPLVVALAFCRPLQTTRRCDYRRGYHY